MVSCETPKDLRPEYKVSNDKVAPGTRNTANVSDAGGEEATAHGEVQPGHAQEQEVMPNHDQGANTIQPGDSIKEEAETNTAAGAVKR